MAVWRDDILQQYKIPPEPWLGRGMEAHVFAYEQNTVLKIYERRMNVGYFTTLQHFYNTLDRQLVPYASPCIHAVVQENNACVTIEQRLPGRTLSTVLATVPDLELEQVMASYLTAGSLLSVAHLRPLAQRYKLFDQDEISIRVRGVCSQGAFLLFLKQ